MSGSSSFFNAVKARRSIYQLSASSPIPDARIVEIVKDAVKYSPSAFNSQSSRAVVAIGDSHKKVWQYVKDVLQAMVPPEDFPKTAKKIDGFAAAYGTVLIFEDNAVIRSQQENIPMFKSHFPAWSEQSHGYLSQTLWTALHAEGLGVNLQHYNPLIDQQITKEFDLPPSWCLMGQLVFGKKEGEAGEKDFGNQEEYTRVFGAK